MDRAADYKPVIGISAACADTASTCAIQEQVKKGGANPVILLDHASRLPKRDIASLDGLILMGNDQDIDPSLYIERYSPDDARRNIHPETKSELATPEGRARAIYEEAIIGLALERKLPLMGICGGMQRINIFLGGTLHQHVPDLVGHEKHCQKKMGFDPRTPILPILIEGGTTLALIAGDIPMSFTTCHSPDMPKVIHENSIHHQAVDLLAPGLKVCALSDGVRFKGGRQGYLIKAFEAHPEGPYAAQCLLGIQWHPEFGASPIGERLAKHLIEAAGLFNQQRS